MPKAFLDTNLPAYAADLDSPAKRERARRLMRETANLGNGVVSTQVLQELYVTLSRKLGVEPLEAKSIVTSLARYEIVTITNTDITAAIDGSILWKVSFWDALILVAVRAASCGIVYSEYLNAGQSYNGVKVANPFE